MASRDKVLVIGGTGAQGLPIVNELIADGKYQVRVLTRDVRSARAKQLASRGVELIQGELTKDADLKRAFEGIDLAFVNTDTFTMGEKAELYHAIKIFEAATRAKTVKHYIWSTLPYLLKTHGEKYNAAHYSTKGRIADFIAGQPGGDASYPGMKYTFFSTCPYMDMLSESMAPRMEGDKAIFEYPLGQGKMPIIALEDVGKYVRYIFDHRDKFIGKTVEAASDTLTLAQFAETYQKVTGKPAESRNVSIEEFYSKIPDNTPLSFAEPEGLTFKDSFGCWWNIYRDGVHASLKDYKYLDTILPDRTTLEKWMKKTNFNGEKKAILKIVEDKAWVIR